MRITVVEFDTTDDHAAAIEAISAALGRNGMVPHKVVAPDDRRLVTSDRGRGLPELETGPPPTPVVETRVSKQLVDTWNWLVACDQASGHTNAAVADGLGIKPATATWRLGQLLNKGLAHRVSNGHYRAGEG